MNITTNTFIGISPYSLKSKTHSDVINKNEYNSFVLKNDTVSFTGKRINKKEIKLIEEQLRNLDGVHDPYSEVILISKQKMNNLKDKISKRETADSTINLLSKYTQHMFPDSELKIFEFLKEETKRRKAFFNGKNKSFDFQDILSDELPYSKTRVIAQQLLVTDEMKQITKKLDKEDQKEALKQIFKIEDSIYDDEFRIQPSKDMLGDLYKTVKNKKIVTELIKKTRDFPNSMTSPDVFVITHANSSHNEIAEALVSPAQISFEHVHPRSKGGATKGGNGIAASRRMNNYRGSRSLKDFIEEFPNIPEYTQQYINDLKQKINRGGIPDIACTLPEVKEALYEQSNGLINIDITGLPISITDRISKFKGHINTLIEHFNQKK